MSRKYITVNMAAAWYPVTVFGPGKKLGVWFQGCSKHCEGCISTEYQPVEGGRCIAVEEVFDLLGDQKPDGLIVSGGEPFDQPEALLALLVRFSEKYGEDILVYTGYTLDELKKKDRKIYGEILESIAVLIDGRYRSSKNTGIGLAGSTNQKIHIMKLEDKYQNAALWERRMMCVLKDDGNIQLIGVPPLQI